MDGKKNTLKVNMKNEKPKAAKVLQQKLRKQAPRQQNPQAPAGNRAEKPSAPVEDIIEPSDSVSSPSTPTMVVIDLTGDDDDEGKPKDMNVAEDMNAAEFMNTGGDMNAVGGMNAVGDMNAADIMNAAGDMNAAGPPMNMELPESSSPFRDHVKVSRPVPLLYDHAAYLEHFAAREARNQFSRPRPVFYPHEYAEHAHHVMAHHQALLANTPQFSRHQAYFPANPYANYMYPQAFLERNSELFRFMNEFYCNTILKKIYDVLRDHNLVRYLSEQFRTPYGDFIIPPYFPRPEDQDQDLEYPGVRHPMDPRKFN